MKARYHVFKSLFITVVSCVFMFTHLPAIATQTSPHTLGFYLAAEDLTSDPLKGPDLQRLDAEKTQLMQMKANPETALVFSIVPGAGHIYAGQPGRGVWVLGGFAATLVISFLGSYLLSTIDSDVARTAAVIFNIAPTSAYIAWGATDAYYQTSLNNERIDNKIKEINLKQKEYGYYSNLFKIYF